MASDLEFAKAACHPAGKGKVQQGTVGSSYWKNKTIPGLYPSELNSTVNQFHTYPFSYYLLNF